MGLESDQDKKIMEVIQFGNVIFMTKSSPEIIYKIVPAFTSEIIIWGRHNEIIRWSSVCLTKNFKLICDQVCLCTR